MKSKELQFRALLAVMFTVFIAVIVTHFLEIQYSQHLTCALAGILMGARMGKLKEILDCNGSKDPITSTS